MVQKRQDKSNASTKKTKKSGKKTGKRLKSQKKTQKNQWDKLWLWRRKKFFPDEIFVYIKKIDLRYIKKMGFQGYQEGSRGK
jgi:hypothetical protein